MNVFDGERDISIDAILRLCQGNHERAQQYVEIFLQQTPTYVAALKSAIQLQDTRHVVSASHSIRNSAALVGAKTLHDLAEHVERSSDSVDVAVEIWDDLNQELESCMAQLRQFAAMVGETSDSVIDSDTEHNSKINNQAATVVIVDDDPLVQMALKLEAESSGLHAYVASDGPAGYQMIRKVKPSLCIVDWMLPGFDGLSLVEKIRHDVITQNTYVIMLTAKTESHDLIRAFHMGVDDFLNKSAGNGELSARIRAGLRLVSLQQELEDKVQEVTQLNGELVELNQQLHSLATTDPLTKLLNRRAVMERLQDAWQQWTRYQIPLCIAMVDVDHFKSINDRYGHDVGDEVLKMISDVFRSDRRCSEIVGRWGGEEFIIGLCHQPEKSAVASAERLLQAIRECEIPASNGMTLHVTASIGVAEADGRVQDIDQLIHNADNILYHSKQSGRDQVSTSSDIH